jgi:hypothetical protein
VQACCEKREREDDVALGKHPFVILQARIWSVWIPSEMRETHTIEIDREKRYHIKIRPPLMSNLFITLRSERISRMFP